MDFSGVRPAAAGGVALVLLPLTGATGLLFARLRHYGASCWALQRSGTAIRGRQPRPWSAFQSATLLVIGAYFIGYQRSELTNSVRPSLTTDDLGCAGVSEPELRPRAEELTSIGMVVSAIVISCWNARLCSSVTKFAQSYRSAACRGIAGLYRRGLPVRRSLKRRACRNRQRRIWWMAASLCTCAVAATVCCRILHSADSVWGVGVRNRSTLCSWQLLFYFHSM